MPVKGSRPRIGGMENGFWGNGAVSLRLIMQIY